MARKKEKPIIDVDKLREIETYDHKDKKRSNNPTVGMAQYDTEEEKEDIAMLLKRELKDSSAFTAFKRWLIWDNEEKYGELEKFIPENQKKKLFDI